MNKKIIKVCIKNFYNNLQNKSNAYQVLNTQNIKWKHSFTSEMFESSHNIAVILKLFCSNLVLSFKEELFLPQFPAIRCVAWSAVIDILSGTRPRRKCTN